MKNFSVILSLFITGVFMFAPAQSMAAKASNYGLPDFTKLVEDTHQSVVNISTIKKTSSRQHDLPQFKGVPEELLKHFFGLPEFHGQSPRREAPQGEPKARPHSLGSGVVISEDGYVLTNHHVIDDADEIIVRLRDRRELIAEVIGTDKRTDVALLKIEAKGLPFAKMGDSSSLKVGQWVLAIGEPFGLDFTATHGIVSALGRSLPDDTYVPFIQTDVPINPGNSGGPLFNLEGEVVGINSQIYSKSGGSMGLSFSIPINIAMNIVNQLKDNGTVARGYLGVQIQEVTSDLAKSFGLSKPQGALVGQTYPGTAAEKAGIEAGDIILEFDGKPIEKSSDLPPIVGITSLSKNVKVKVLRNGKVMFFTVKLNALDQATTVAKKDKGSSQNDRLGATVKALDKEALEQLGLPFGVVVTQIETGSSAAKAGLRQGDVIVTIDFKPIKNAKRLDKVVKELPEGRSLPVRVVRDKRSLFLPLILD